MDIEELVKKYGCGQFGIESIIRAVLNEQAAWYEQETKLLRAQLKYTLAQVAEREAHITQLEAERVPEGWVIERANDEIIIRNHEIGGCVVKRSPTESRVIPESILWELANAMLAAAPAKEGK